MRRRVPGRLHPLAQPRVRSQTIGHHKRRAVVFPALDNVMPFCFRQPVDGLQQGHLQWRLAIDEQVDLDRPSRGDFPGSEGLNAVIAFQVQEFKAVVEAHESILCAIMDFDY